jgi:hypothetical protein
LLLGEATSFAVGHRSTDSLIEKELTMRTSKLCVVAGVLVTLPLAASAQSADTKYCQALGAKYENYVHSMTDQQRGAQPPTANVGNAVSKCGSAPGDAIPVLEKALKDAKVDLPPRG